MEDTYPSNLRLWESPTALAEQELLSWTGQEYARPGSPVLPGPHNPAEFARRLFAMESLSTPPPPTRHEDPVEPFSLQWFLTIENRRHSRQGRWIPRLMEFSKHSGETLLGLGSGLGTDWLQYARHGANVIACSASASQLGLIQRNFELRGLKGRFVHAQPTRLPLESASIDVVCLSSLGQEREDAECLVEEIYRVLKPGGKVLALARARHDVDYWHRTVFFWHRWLGPRTRNEEPLPPSYSQNRLRRLFGRFVEQRVHKRQLRRSDVPHIWRWLPLPLLARMMGRVLVLKAFKPLSSAINYQVAAA